MFHLTSEWKIQTFADVLELSKIHSWHCSYNFPSCRPSRLIKNFGFLSCTSVRYIPTKFHGNIRSVHKFVRIFQHWTNKQRTQSIFRQSIIYLPSLSITIFYSPNNIHGENFTAIFTTLSVVIWFSTGTLGIFATLVYVFTMCVVIYDILSMAIITTLSTSIQFCNLCYILLGILPRSEVKIAIRI